jgi:hypothetical protein
MSKLLSKINNSYKGIVTYNDIKYTDQQLQNMSEEFSRLEKSLSKKYKNYDSEYSYELGKILSSKLAEYRIVESERYEFWKMLREYVNKKDSRKTITNLRDAYEYCYLLSKLPRELSVKYSRSKWDHLFDITTARKDNRIYIWLMSVDNNDFINSNKIFQNFCKGLKNAFKDVDTGVYTDSEINDIYDDVMKKSIFLINFMKNNNVNFNSKFRDMFYVRSKNINYSDEKELNEILKNLL